MKRLHQIPVTVAAVAALAGGLSTAAWYVLSSTGRKIEKAGQ